MKRVNIVKIENIMNILNITKIVNIVKLESPLGSALETNVPFENSDLCGASHVPQITLEEPNLSGAYHQTCCGKMIWEAYIGVSFQVFLHSH